MQPADASDPLAVITGRRSIGRVGADPVGRDLVEELLRAAVTAPNHHQTRPWRFVVLAGPSRRAVGDAHVAALEAGIGPLSADRREREASRLERAPVVVACVVRRRSDDVVQRREDRDAVAAAVQNLLLAAHARGLGAMWRTGAMTDEALVRRELGVAGDDEIVGFVYLGRPALSPPPRTTDDPLEGVVEWRWSE